MWRLTTLWQRLLAQSWWLKSGLLAVAVVVPLSAAAAVIALSGGGKDADSYKTVVGDGTPTATRTNRTGTRGGVTPTPTPATTVSATQELVPQATAEVRQAPPPPVAPQPQPAACQPGFVLVWNEVCLAAGYGDYPTWAVDQVSYWFFGLVGAIPSADDIAINRQVCSASPDTYRDWRVACSDTGGEYLVNHDTGGAKTANATAEAAVAYWIDLWNSPPPPSGTILVARDGQFLGNVTCNEFDSDGIFNRFGSYGSQFSSTSIWNQFGTYGSQFGSYSPFNKFGQAPEILDGNSLVAYLTVSAISTPAVTPEELVYSCFKNSPGSLDYWLGLVVDRT